MTCLNGGLEGRIVEVQVDVATGAARFNLVGLADAGLKEARERVRSPIRNGLQDLVDNFDWGAPLPAGWTFP